MSNRFRTGRGAMARAVAGVVARSRVIRTGALAVSLVLSGAAAQPLLSGVASSQVFDIASTPAVAYSAPVPEPLHVVRAFDPPTSPYGPGHRGVDLDVDPGQIVRSAAAGVVSFAGPVAGRDVIVVVHPDGVSTEYEPVRPRVTAGESVRRAQVLGRLVGTDAGCGQPHCLHWGARRDGTYLDPLSLLAPLGPVRLLPWPEDVPAAGSG